MQSTLTDSHFDFNEAVLREEPFRHVVVPNFIRPELAGTLLEWFERDAPWQFQSTKNFYEAYHLKLTAIDLPESIKCLVGPDLISKVRLECERLFQVELDNDVEVSAHRMEAGFSAGIHTDSGPDNYSHRLLIQINRGWVESNGGILMLLESRRPEELSEEQEFYLPLHGSAIAMEISEVSYHAVSEINSGQRFTLKYSFFRRR